MLKRIASLAAKRGLVNTDEQSPSLAQCVAGCLLKRCCVPILFLFCLAFFIERGPYRAIRYSTTGDFSTVYAAARSWMHGANPYDRATLKTELARAGAPADLQHDQDVNPSVYLPAALPWAFLVAWLPWPPANTLWCLLSVVLFAFSVSAILSRTGLSPRHKLLVASAVLLFSPTYVGIYDGNPAVIVISLVALCICAAAEQGPNLATGVLLGVAMCFKPQIAICGLCVLALWRRWVPIFVGLAVLCVMMAAGLVVVSHLGHTWQWWHSEQQNVAISFQIRGQSDPTPGSHVAWQLLNTQTILSYLITNRRVCDLATWMVAAILTGAFLYKRNEPRTRSMWRDVAFFSAITLVITYHRYYDAQILLLSIPLLLRLWRDRKTIPFVTVSVCLLLLAFPVQTVLARRFGSEAAVASFPQFIALRNQPVAVLILAIAFAFCRMSPPETLLKPDHLRAQTKT